MLSGRLSASDISSANKDYMEQPILSLYSGNIDRFFLSNQRQAQLKDAYIQDTHLFPLGFPHNAETEIALSIFHDILDGTCMGNWG